MSENTRLDLMTSQPTKRWKEIKNQIHKIIPPNTRNYHGPEHWEIQQFRENLETDL